MKKKYIIIISVVVLTLLLFAYHHITSIHSHESLNGISIEQSFEKRGTPKYDVQFILSDSSLYEYRRGLKNTYPLYNQGSQKILIREIAWERWGRTNVIWFEKSGSGWRSVDNLSWGLGVHF